MKKLFLGAGFLVFLFGLIGPGFAFQTGDPDDVLAAFFAEWRNFEKPELLDGAPDYTPSASEGKLAGLKDLQARLAAMDTGGWPVISLVDRALIGAEMNGMDFNIRVLKPWQRDPAFYQVVWTEQSDTPAHEGPTNAAVLDLWTFSFPLSEEAEAKLTAELMVIPPFLNQAKGNLTGNARDLWVAGISNIKDQSTALKELREAVGENGEALKEALEAAIAATDDFAAWLEAEVPNKTGPSGVGKENYTWYLQNVHLVPMTWEDEVMLLKRELARAHASLKLEELRNRDLPQLVPISSPEEFERRANQAVDYYMAFLEESRLHPVTPNMDPAMRAHMGEFVPEEERNFFLKTVHLDPTPLYTHWYHWWDLARMRDDPNPDPVRRGPLLYNIFDNRSEGMATAMEELVLHAGLYDQNPRAREIVWIMAAQRAARGLGSLYAQANIMTMAEAAQFHTKWTPRAMMSPNLSLLAFEQQLYLRQPGYGTSYITGKFLIDQLIKDVVDQRGEDFNFYDFFAEFDAAGVIPVSLIRWLMAGDGGEIEAILDQE